MHRGSTSGLLAFFSSIKILILNLEPIFHGIHVSAYKIRDKITAIDVTMAITQIGPDKLAELHASVSHT